MNEKLQMAVATVMQERTQKFDKSFATVKELVALYPPEELADRLVVDIPATVPWEVTADVLGILIWSTSDNGGASIMRSAERWLIEAKDIRRVQIALSLDVYPFDTIDEMRRVLAAVSLLFPELAAHCKSCIAERARLRE